MNLLPWIILFLPLVASAFIVLFAGRNRTLSGGVSIAAVVVGFILSLVYLGWAGWNGWVPGTSQLTSTWLEIGDFHVDVALRLDSLSLLMLLLVTGVASLIHIYSLGYLREDTDLPRYFASLSLFTFAMVGIVLSNNFVQLFIFWELVGVSSYLLIGFWYEKPAAADAAKKAFITNRLGDFGFLLGILLVWSRLGSLNFSTLEQSLLTHPAILGGAATTVGLLLFCGAVGKSAQFPLHVWLPDAMEGPTPVSALIHAATMVAAGVYMLCRIFFLLHLPGSHALQVISWSGAFTALLSALIALQQNDIKRILAYSTLSQLGYMVMSVGLAAPSQAMYHLATHAFFKALLFLGAGSVILALHHEQDIWRMGGLRKKMPVTFWTFLAGTLALAGMWPLSGFYSKDAILAAAAVQNPALFVVGLLVAMLTTLYMFRLFFVVFTGNPRTDTAGHAVEAPGVMAWPLRILAIFSIFGGLLGLEPLLRKYFVEGAAFPSGFVGKLFYPFAHAPLAASLGLLAVLIGFFLAQILYSLASKDWLTEKLGPVGRAMQNRFYFDEFYRATVIRFHDLLAAVAQWIERWLIAGFAVRGTHGTTEIIGRALRLLQTGSLQMYALLLVLGAAFLLWFALLK